MKVKRPLENVVALLFIIPVNNLELEMITEYNELDKSWQHQAKRLIVKRSEVMGAGYS